MDDGGRERAVQLFADRYGAVPGDSRLSSLEELLRAFAALPYENLSKIVSWNGGRDGPASRVQLRDPLTVMSEHLVLGTGGTCFSLTELLRCLLEAAGFAAAPLMAHMRHGENIHCALRVEVNGRGFIVDPGYLLHRPLPLEPGRPHGGGGPMLVRAGTLEGAPRPDLAGELDLFTLDGERPHWRYRFSARPVCREEFLAHWRRSFTLPAMRSMLASRRAGEELVYLHNHKLRRSQAGRACMQNVRDALPASVQQVFGIHPDVTRRALEILRAERQAWQRVRPAQRPEVR